MSLTLTKLAKQAGRALEQKGLILASAESCTGGGFGYYLTSIPGSSAWFDRGFITYSNQAKIEMLGVSERTLLIDGAVSEATAIAMAEGVLAKCSADISIAITGIAGPGGGSDLKPIGTVWMAIAQKDKPTIAFLEVFPGNRRLIRLHTIEKLLRKLIECLA